jgi:hypothetical protein
MATTSLNRQAAALVSALQAASRPQPDPVPPEWLTFDQLVRETRLPDNKLHELLATVAERRSFKLLRGTKLSSVPHYRLKPSSSPKPQAQRASSCGMVAT